jgi:hypothetical protein
MPRVGRGNVGVAATLLEEFLRLPVGVRIIGAQWHRSTESVVFDVEGDLPIKDVMLMTPTITNVDDHVWGWQRPPREKP